MALSPRAAALWSAENPPANREVFIVSFRGLPSAVSFSFTSALSRSTRYFTVARRPVGVVNSLMPWKPAPAAINKGVMPSEFAMAGSAA